ncbi:MAG: hypothetical protein CM15mP45_19760 [Deltaproteobacteria bacterium]|nr:MAG: hypothetical protein CM15mP45_19760 [Deltaproteobacteria bacterium]
MKLLDGQRALITGAGSGIGKVMAQHFEKAGARIWICDADTNNLEQSSRKTLTGMEPHVMSPRRHKWISFLKRCQTPLEVWNPGQQCWYCRTYCPGGRDRPGRMETFSRGQPQRCFLLHKARDTFAEKLPQSFDHQHLLGGRPPWLCRGFRMPPPNGP